MHSLGAPGQAAPVPASLPAWGIGGPCSHGLWQPVAPQGRAQVPATHVCEQQSPSEEQYALEHVAVQNPFSQVPEQQSPPDLHPTPALAHGVAQTM
jgi:hypothetical protein